MEKIRRLHRIMGTIMLLPFLIWATTAMIFFVKPGYGPAYEMPSLKTYPLGETGTPALSDDWLEVRLLRTVLGVHLLARDESGWSNRRLDGTPWPFNAEEARKLLNDTFTGRPRYGTITEVTGALTRTDTGVRINLDWQRLSLYQEGPDTDRIQLAYRLHYLQFTGVKNLDRVLGFLGLILLVGLAASGARLLLRGRGLGASSTD